MGCSVKYVTSKTLMVFLYQVLDAARRAFSGKQSIAHAPHQELYWEGDHDALPLSPYRSRRGADLG